MKGYRANRPNRDDRTQIIKDMKVMKYWVLILVIALGSCDGRLKKENERLREELARTQQYVPLQRDTIRDSVKIVTQKIVEVERIKEVLSKDDQQLIKDLGIRVKELEALMKTGIETKDSVLLSARDSTGNAPLYYKDAWAEFEYQDKRLRYSVKDSLAVAIKREYKHRFLWWKWKVKGYEVKVVNFNPHARVRYNSYVKDEG